MSYNFTKEQIEHAYDVAGSAMGASRLLGVKIDTYKKYAEMYGCYRKNQSGKGTHKNRTFIENPDINIHYFDIIDSSDKAYILGYLLADGTVRDNSLRIYISYRDREILEYICSKLNINVSKIIDYVCTNIYKGEHREFQCSRLSVLSQHIVHTLNSYSLVVNRVIDNIDLFSSIPEEMMLPCVAGYIDGNGAFSHYNCSINIVSNMITCTKLSSYLKNFGITNTRIYDHGKHAELIFTGNKEFLYAYISSNEFLLHRKIESADLMLSRILKLTDTHIYKKFGHVNYCIDCKKIICTNSLRCKSCAAKIRQQSTNKRPSKSILVNELLIRNFLKKLK